MISHEYNFRLKDLLSLFVNLLIAILLFGVLARLGALGRLLPSPWPALDVDRTVLTHQLAATQRSSRAELLLIGDSSCLMDVSVPKLEEAFHQNSPALNLGTLMYVGFDGYAAMLSHYAQVNPGTLQTVVVLVHPEMLRQVKSGSPYLSFMSDFYAGTDPVDSSSFVSQLRGFLGLNIFEDRLLSRTPLPLPGEYGRYYGFNVDLYCFMSEHGGSAVDPHQYASGSGLGSAEYRFAAVLESECRALRAVVPPGAKLAFGLTPIPESFAPSDYPGRWRTILTECAASLNPDVLLTNLPPTMPDANFASTTHLNAKGSSAYTDILARCLKTDLGTLSRNNSN